MNPKILRTYDKNQVFGDFSYEDFKCKTLELAWLENKREISCIPEDSYPYTKEIHPKYGKVLRLHKVPDRDGVLAHYGNFAGSLNPKSKKPDTLGCILFGSGYGDIDKDGILDILDSKNTMEKVYDLLPDKGILEISKQWIDL